MDWTYGENNLGAKIIQGTNAAVTKLVCGLSTRVEVRMRVWLQQSNKLGWESGRGDWQIFEVAICNRYTFNDPRRYATSQPPCRAIK